MKVNNRRRVKMKKRTAAVIALAIALVITIFAGYISLNGMWLDSRGLYKLLPWVPKAGVTKETWPQSISLGLDLKGGVYVEYVATLSDELEGDTNVNFDTLLSNTMDIIAKRLSDKGYTETTVSKIGTNGIRVEIPDVTDPSVVLDLIGSPAKLEFLDSDGNVFMEGSMLKTATATTDEDGNPAISFTLTSEGAQLFGDETAASIGSTITIQLDGTELMSPTVNEAIYGGNILVTGSFTEDEAETYALQLQSGALPLDLTQDKLDTISATLGDNALTTSVNAAMIGILLVMLFMMLRYRLSGVLASWALAVYIMLMFLFLAVVPGIQLTLPGIAGIILGIGMAVDANVIIFERVKEEAYAGRPMIHAVRIGFKNAMSAVLDANVTTIIASIVLLFYGTGSVQGFAATLLLSVIASMITAIVVTRFLLVRTVTLFKNPNLYVSGMKKHAVKPAAATGRRSNMDLKIKNYSKPAILFALAIMLVALLMSVFGYGVNYGIDFAGGLDIQYEMNSTFDQADVETALRNQGLTDFKVSTTGTEQTSLDIRIPQLDTQEEIQNLQSALEEELLVKYPDMDTADATATYVGPTAGATLVRNAIISVLLASVLMLGYIAIRFDLFSGIAAVVGLLHDVLIMFSFMVILRSIIQMNSSFIAAMLTIVGYSINNTIVIFDRIRENNHSLEYSKLKRDEVVNISIAQCMGRTVNTTITTLVTVVCLYIMGVSSIREFTLPIIVGILAGLYSSNLIAGYVWAFLEEKFKGRKKAAKLKAKKPEAIAARPLHE